MRVPDEVRKCVVFLGFRMADGTFKICGTALYFEVIFASRRGSCLVTARHVVDGIRKLGLLEVYIRINTLDGGSKWFSSTIDQWLLPSDPSLDASIMWAGVPSGADHLILNQSTVLTQSTVTELGIGVGEEVFITGLFVHQIGEQRNTPIVRVGNLASYPEERIRSRVFGEMDAYLIAARSIGGLSGSPVFVHTGQVRVIKGQIQQAAKPMFYLIGIVHGHYQKNEKEPGSDDVETLNTGIAIVVPMQKIQSFIDTVKD